MSRHTIREDASGSGSSPLAFRRAYSVPGSAHHWLSCCYSCWTAAAVAAAAVAGGGWYAYGVFPSLISPSVAPTDACMLRRVAVTMATVKTSALCSRCSRRFASLHNAAAANCDSGLGGLLMTERFRWKTRTIDAYSWLFRFNEGIG